MTGVAEAGEVDRRIQIPIHGRASVAAAVDAVAHPELGFHSAAASTVESTEKTWARSPTWCHTRWSCSRAGCGCGPSAASPSARLRPRLAPAAPAHVLGGQLLDHDDLVAGRQGRWSLGGSAARGSRPPLHESGPPGRWRAPSVSTAPAATSCRDRRGHTGAPLAVGPPAAATAPGSTVGAPRSAPTSTPSGGGDHQQILDPDIDTHHRMRAIGGRGRVGTWRPRSPETRTPSAHRTTSP